MASPLQFLLCSFICLITISAAQRPCLPSAATVLPVTKDLSTLQYVTQIYWGTPIVPIKLAVDLGSPFLWIDCASRHVSSSYHPIHSGSLQCSMAKASDSGNGNCFSCTKPWQKSNNICGLNPENTITSVAMRGELAEDIIAVGSDQMGSITTVHHFLFSCAPTSLLQGLSSGVKGILGLGRSRIALPSQLATTLGFHRKFAVCLSSSAGVILTGDGHSAGTDIFKSLTYTPLITNQAGTLEQYYINVKSIKINGKRLSLNTSLLAMDQKGYGGTKISTVVPYTTLESTIYDTFVKAYSKTATSMNMTRVAPVAPFRVCFSTEGLDTTPVGPTVPTIDLVLQSEMVKWRIYGRNSMVKVSNEVMCLGFLDGGLNSRNSIVIGGYQLEDNLLEFNLGTSMLGFSSSLLLRESCCSNFNSMPTDI